MYKKILISFLCVSLSWTAVFPAYAASTALPVDEQTIRAQYPDAQIIHVSPEDYPALEQRLSREGYRTSGDELQLSANDTYSPHTASRVATESASDDCYESPRDQRSGDDDSLRLAVQVTSDLTSSRGNNSGGAPVVFVVIGAVVLVVWTLYLFKYLYDVSFGIRPCARWSELTVSSSSIVADANEHARFSGLRYRAGSRSGSTDFGLSAEAGYADIRLHETSALALKGTYWWLGPMLRWRFGEAGNPHYFQMEFVAGSTEHDAMGLMALAKMGVNFGVGNGFRWGLNFGAINFDLNENQGVITERNQYYYLLGLDLGYQF